VKGCTYASSSKQSELVLQILALLTILLTGSGCSGTNTGITVPTPTSTVPTKAPAPTDPTSMAQVVYAQPDFTTSTLYPTAQNTLKNAGAITADQHGGIYVADYGNSRVLHFPKTNAHGAGPEADQVYGQTDYTSNTVRHDANGLNYPHGVAIDAAGGLYICDMFNNRILHYPSASSIPNRVYGQSDYTSHEPNNGGVDANTLFHPQGIVANKSGLYVADSGNNRVLHYPLNSTTPDFVYGQGTPGNSQNNFTSNASGSGSAGLNTPRDIAVDNSGLYVADSGNHRILHYTLGGSLAERVYGQPDFSSASVQPNQGKPNPTATTLNTPTGIAVDSHGGLYIADRNNNRVLYYPPKAQSSGNDPAAARVYGQPSYATDSPSTTASTFHGPGAVGVDAQGDLFVLDIFNQRVLKFVTPE